jgi:hypothetical protein
MIVKVIVDDKGMCDLRDVSLEGLVYDLCFWIDNKKREGYIIPRGDWSIWTDRKEFHIGKRLSLDGENYVVLFAWGVPKGISGSWVNLLYKIGSLEEEEEENMLKFVMSNYYGDRPYCDEKRSLVKKMRERFFE